MRWYWLKDQIHPKRYDVYFMPGSQKKADLQNIIRILITDNLDLHFLHQAIIAM